VRVLVAYASKYGSTKGIAEFIAENLQSRGIDVDAKDVNDVHNLSDYSAFVIGSAVFLGKWMNEASDFILRNRDTLTTRPVWLFSSGPLVTELKDKQGRDPREGALLSKELEKLTTAAHPRDHGVFFGALDSNRLSFSHKTIRKMPAARAVMPEGDFRNWKDIEAWTDNIARELGPSLSTY
jgi:menaquinone-dependent protoporphyrinogen oxidase